MSTELISETCLSESHSSSVAFTLVFIILAILFFKNVCRRKWIITPVLYITKLQNAERNNGNGKYVLGMTVPGKQLRFYYAWELPDLLIELMQFIIFSPKKYF